MQVEEMAQQTRVANFLNTEVGSAGGFGTTAVTTTRNFVTLKWDLAGQETNKMPTDLLAMVVADTKYRETYTTPYKKASTDKATSANLKKWFQIDENEAGIIKLTAQDRDASTNKYSTWSRQQWLAVITAAETKLGASVTAAGGIWKEVEAVKGSATATVSVITDAVITLAGLFKKDGTTAVNNRATLNAALLETGAKFTVQQAAEMIAGAFELNKATVTDATANKYLLYPRRVYSAAVCTKYTMSTTVKTKYPFIFDEDQIALNLYARVFKQEKYVAATSFKIVDSSKTTAPAAAFIAPLTLATTTNFSVGNLGMYSFQMADNDAFYKKKFTYDITAAGNTPTDFGMDQSKMATLLSKGVYTSAELQWALVYAKGNDGANAAAKGTNALAKVLNLNSKIGRESLKKVVDEGQNLFGDYHHKAAFATRPTRTTHAYDATIKGLADANVAPAGSPAKTQFADIARFTWDKAFGDSLTTADGHVNLNFQGSEDFAYALKEGKARMTTANVTGAKLTTYVNLVLDEIEKRDFEWWNTWSDATKVPGNFEINKRASTAGVHSDIASYFSIYSVVDYLGA
jgi:hypothetical protein